MTIFGVRLAPYYNLAAMFSFQFLFHEFFAELEVGVYFFEAPSFEYLFLLILALHARTYTR